MKYWDSCSWEERIERWENVARVLKSLSPHEKARHFDMSVWGTQTECGTVACAAGHCGLDPWFRKKGFKMDLRKRVFTLSVDIIEYGIPSGEAYMGEDIKIPIVTTSISDVSHFFGCDGSDNIFFRTKIRSINKVAREVEQHIKKLKKLKKESRDGKTWLAL